MLQQPILSLFIRCPRRSRNSNRGFTLLELLLGLVITSVVIGFALKAIVEANGSFEKDKKDIQISQTNLSLLQIIGDNIKAAGENIGDSLFPVIEIKPNTATGAMAGSSVLVVRRAVVPGFLSCSLIPADYTGTTLEVIASLVAGCNPINPTTNNLPSPVTRSFAITQARKYRCSQDILATDYTVVNTDFCQGNTNEYALGFLADRAGNYRSFKYTGDTYVNTTTAETISISNLSASAPNLALAFPAFSSIYIVQERSYTLDSTGLLSVEFDRSGVKLPLLDRIAQFSVSARVYSDLIVQSIDPVDGTQKLPVARRCASTTPAYICHFNTKLTIFGVPIADNWKTLAGVRVRLVAKYDSRGDAATAADPSKLEATSEFFPRNVLSR